MSEKSANNARNDDMSLRELIAAAGTRYKYLLQSFSAALGQIARASVGSSQVRYTISTKSAELAKVAQL